MLPSAWTGQLGRAHSSQAKLLSGLHFLTIDGQMCSLLSEEVSHGVHFQHTLLWASGRLMVLLTQEEPSQQVGLMPTGESALQAIIVQS